MFSLAVCSARFNDPSLRAADNDISHVSSRKVPGMLKEKVVWRIQALPLLLHPEGLSNELRHLSSKVYPQLSRVSHVLRVELPIGVLTLTLTFTFTLTSRAPPRQIVLARVPQNSAPLLTASPILQRRFLFTTLSHAMATEVPFTADAVRSIELIPCAHAPTKPPA